MQTGGKKCNGKCCRQLAERALGKPLPKDAQVHQTLILRAQQLVICQDFKYHRLLHVRTHVLRAGGNPNTQRLCYRCRKLKLINEMVNRQNWVDHAWECKRCGMMRTPSRRKELAYAR